MDMAATRRAHLLASGELKGVGLEIGAFARPTITDPKVEMRYLDFYTTEQLREQAASNGGNPDDVMRVDYVATGEDYRAAVGDERFDFIIANHVFEHIVNPVAWLAMLCELLKPDGRLLLTIPDRTPYCFDRFREPTTFAHLMWDYLSDATHEQKAWVHALDTNIYYDRTFINQTINADKLFDIENMKKARHHPGVHCHVFIGPTFLNKIMKPLLYKRIVDFTLLDFEPRSRFGEFYVTLRKGWTPFEFSLEEFYGQSIAHPVRPPEPPPGPSVPFVDIYDETQALQENGIESQRREVMPKEVMPKDVADALEATKGPWRTYDRHLKP